MSRLLLTTLEIASGAVPGSADEPMRAAAPTRLVRDPLDALRATLLPALLRPPCLLSFSGGNDSSLLLALAVDLARREGLALPIPVTWRFQNAPRADESQWQEEIIHALDLPDWHRLSADDDLDLVGPVAQSLLRRLGVRYPANLHLHLPIIAAAHGGSVVTGFGGDQVLTCWNRLPPAGLRRIIPAGVRAAARPRQARAERPWLRPEPARLVHRRERLAARQVPRDPAERIAWRTSRRQFELTQRSCDDLASTEDVQIHHPLLDPGFHAALSASIPADAHMTRSGLIGRISAGRIPPVVYRRTSKAWFGEVFLREPTRRFTSTWDGQGADGDFVDADALRTAWSCWPIPAGTGLLAQQLWLDSACDSTGSRPAARGAFAAPLLAGEA